MVAQDCGNKDGFDRNDDGGGIRLVMVMERFLCGVRVEAVCVVVAVERCCCVWTL